jgi:predicted transcriptional regulator
MAKETEGRKTYGLRLDQALMKKLKHLAVDEDKASNELIEEAIRDLLKKYRGTR